MVRANKKFLDTEQLKEYEESFENLFSFDKSDDDKTRTMIVYIEPRPKGRPRFTRSGHAYTPKETAEYEEVISRCWRLSHLGTMTGTIKVRLDFYMPIPKSMSKADKQAAINKELVPAKKPDIDNLAKAILDALNEVAYWDDRQITRLVLSKWYSTVPRVEISITEI